MKFEYKKVGEKSVRYTTSNERWYANLDDKGYPINLVPSVTWICHYYPKGEGFARWQAKNGYDESKALAQAAAEKGSKIHHGIEMLLRGQTIKHDQKIINTEKGVEEEITAEEYEAIMSFADWFSKNKPKIISTERNVIGEKFAGTIDFICEIEKELWIIDFKSGQGMWGSYDAQLSAYNMLLGGGYKLGILQVGYQGYIKNPEKFKFTEIVYQPELFNSAYTFWLKEATRKKPLEREYPLEIKLII